MIVLAFFAPVRRRRMSAALMSCRLRMRLCLFAMHLRRLMRLCHLSWSRLLMLLLHRSRWLV